MGGISGFNKSALKKAPEPEPKPAAPAGVLGGIAGFDRSMLKKAPERTEADDAAKFTAEETNTIAGALKARLAAVRTVMDDDSDSDDDDSDWD